jgi:hypothetical protein
MLKYQVIEVTDTEVLKKTKKTGLGWGGYAC